MTQDYSERDFDGLRPLSDSEVPAAMVRLTETRYFREAVISRLLPGADVMAVCAHMRSLTTKLQFQQAYIFPLLHHMVETTTTEFTQSGLDDLAPDCGYLFVTNHRDIIMDSAFLCEHLLRLGRPVCEIGIGSNLLIYPWIEDLVKANRSFVVRRDLPPRQMLEASRQLSTYIRWRVGAGQTMWLAEREGRSKDSNDRAQASVFKMLNLSAEGKVSDNFRDLHIVPVAITYEYDPCDYLKAQQAQEKRDNPDYKKRPDEDLTHMSVGFKGQKGRVHYSFGSPLDSALNALDAMPRNQAFDHLCNIVDQRIHSSYRLFPGNHVALDLLNGTNLEEQHYTAEERQAFEQRLEEQIAKLPEGDHDFLRHVILQAYANPLINQRNAEGKGLRV